MWGRVTEPTPMSHVLDAATLGLSFPRQIIFPPLGCLTLVLTDCILRPVNYDTYVTTR